MLEIGCGTGMTSLWLAKHGHKVTALDYTNESIQLVRKAAEKLNIMLDTVVADAVKELPFGKNQFDYVFQSGLLEHFSRNQQITMLKNWSVYGRNMISMIPNAASLPYQAGKKIMEEKGTWEYGLEVPRHSLAAEFAKAGIKDIREYTIGTEWAVRFLPRRHYLRKTFKRLIKDGYNLEDYMQGYLLVTIGACK